MENRKYTTCFMRNMCDIRDPALSTLMGNTNKVMLSDSISYETHMRIALYDNDSVGSRING